MTGRFYEMALACNRPRRSSSDATTPMRVMEIISGTEIDGAAVHCAALSRELARRGHEVTLVCRPGAWVAGQLGDERIAIVESSLDRGPPRELQRIARIARERGVGVVHTHMSRAHAFGVLLRLFFRIPTVATAHSRHIQLHWPLNDRVIAVSEATRRYHRRWNAVGRRRIETVHNFVDLARFEGVSPEARARLRSAWGIPAASRVIGSVGRVEEEKGTLDLVEALAAIRRDGADARLVLVGRAAPESPYVRLLEARARALGLAGAVVLGGQQENVAEVMSAFDLYTTSSREESLSVAVLEAMAIGLAVVATAVGGQRESVEDGVTGSLVPARDPQRLAAACLALLRDEDQARRYGARGRERVVKRFSAASQVPKIEAILNAVGSYGEP